MGTLRDAMFGGGQQMQSEPQEVGPTSAPAGNAQQPSSMEMTPQDRELVKKAINLLYGDNFPKLVEMFKKGGADQFARSMAMAVNSVLERLEKDMGQPMDAMTAAKVGVQVFMALLQDLFEGGIIQNVSKEQFLQSIEMIIRQWVKEHPDQADPQQMRAAVEQIASEMMGSGDLQDGEVVPPSMMRGGAESQQPGDVEG